MLKVVHWGKLFGNSTYLKVPFVKFSACSELFPAKIQNDWTNGKKPLKQRFEGYNFKDEGTKAQLRHFRVSNA